jgi:hypothetical protein
MFNIWYNFFSELSVLGTLSKKCFHFPKNFHNKTGKLFKTDKTPTPRPQFLTHKYGRRGKC